MKKYLLSLIAVAGALTASAAAPQATVFPSAGKVATQGEVATKGGMSSVTLTIMGGVLDRECTGFVTLSKDGQQVMAIPASNERRIKLDDPDAGAEGGETSAVSNTVIRINFWDGGLDTSPFIYNGSYQMIVPSGLYTVNGEGNNPFLVNWTISDHAYQPGFTATPASGSNIVSLSEITLAFEGATTVTLEKASGIYAPDPFFVADPDLGEDEAGEVSDIVPNVSVNGNLVTLTFPKPVDKKCNIALTIEDGAFKVDGVDCLGSILNYTVLGTDTAFAGDIDITPAPGTYKGGIPATEANFPLNSTTGKAYAIFDLKLPEGVTAINQKNMLMAASKKQYGIKDASGNYVSVSMNYKVANDNSSMYFVNNGFNGGQANWGTDTMLGLAPGTYFFFADAGIFSYTLADGTVESNPQISWGPFIIEPSEVDYTVDPTPGSTLDELKDFTFTFPEDATLKMDTWNYWAEVKNGTIVYDIKAVVEGNKVVVSNPAEMTTPGEYTVEITGLTVNGAPCTVTSYYTVERQFLSDITLKYGDKLVDATYSASEGWNASVVIPEGQALQLSVVVPVGYDAVYYRDNNAAVGGEDPEDELTSVAPGIQFAMIPVSELIKPENGSFKEAENGVIPVKYGLNDLTLTYVVDGGALNPTPVMINVEKNNTTGVEAVEVAGAEAAEYYTLQGVKVVNPENGVYIKVANGKAEKVVVK